jgi:hypothetical protein
MIMHRSIDEAFAPRRLRRRMVLDVNIGSASAIVGWTRMQPNRAFLGLSLMTPSSRTLRREIGSTAAFRTLANVIL